MLASMDGGEKIVCELINRKARVRADVLPVEVRCYISDFICLVRNARCNTMSHLTAAAGFSYTSRETLDVTPCNTSPLQGVVVVSICLRVTLQVDVIYLRMTGVYSKSICYPNGLRLLRCAPTEPVCETTGRG